MKYIILICLLFGCGSDLVQKPKATNNCFDYESCQRTCKLFNDKHSCESKKLFHKK